MNDALNYSIVVSLDQASTKAAMDELRKLREQAEQVAQAAQTEAIKETADALKGFNKVSIDTQKVQAGTLSGLADLQKQMGSYKADLKVLEVQSQIQNGLTDEQAAAQEELKVKLKATSTEYNRQQREMVAVATAGDKAAVTYDDLVKQNRALMIEMRKVPMDDTSGKLAKMQGQYKANSDRLKEFDKTIGNNFRNVGNYRDALEGMGGALSNMGGPVGGATQSFMGFNAVMRANPIMAITQLFLGLISILSKLQVASDGLAKAMAAVSAAFEYSRDVIGSWFGLNERNNRSMAETIRLSLQLKQAEQDLADTRIAGLAPMATMRMEISKLREQLNNENLTNEERIALIDQALAKEAKLADAEEYLARERFRIAKEQAALNESDRATQEEVANAEVELIQVRENSYNRRRELGEKRKTLIEAERAAERARVDNLKKLEQELANARAFTPPTEDVADATDFSKDIENEAKRNELLMKAGQDYFRAKQLMEIEAMRAGGDEMGAILRERELALQDIRIQAINDGITSEDEIKQMQAAKELEYTQKLEKAKTDIAKAAIENRSKLVAMGIEGAMKLGTALFGQGKAISIAQALIDTYQSANTALKSAPPPFNFALAAANVAAGLANVNRIRNMKPGSSGSGGGGSGASTISAPGAPAPSFGTVSAGIGAPRPSVPSIVLAGEFDSEYLAVKVRKGNDAISSRGVTVESV